MTPFTKHLPITIAKDRFEEIISYLSQSFRVVPFSTLVKDRFNRNLVSVTFDDGYRNFMSEASPVLERHNCPAKVFLNSEQVQGQLGWLNQLSIILENAANDQIEQMLIEGFPACPTRPFNAALARKYFTYPDSLVAINRLFSRLKNLPPHDNEFLNERDVRRLSEHHLIEWGSHSHRHLPFEKLSRDQIREEIMVCHRYLQAILGLKLEGFALPFGKVEVCKPQIADMVAQIDRYFVTAMGDRINQSNVGELARIDRIKGEWGLPRIKQTLPSN